MLNLLSHIFNDQHLFDKHLSRLFACLFMGTLLVCLGLTLWQISLVSNITTSQNTMLNNLMPSLADTYLSLKTLATKGLFINGLILVLCITLQGNRPEDFKQYKSLLLISILWNSVLMLDLSGWQFVNNSASLLKLSNLFQIYPSSESMTDFFLHLGYFLGWIVFFFVLRNSVEQGSLYFQPHVYQFLNLAHAAYGGALILSLMTSNAIAPLIHEHQLLLTLQWSQEYFFKAAITFGLLGAFYGLAVTTTTSKTFSSLAFPHWFALLLGFALVFIASTTTHLTPIAPESMHFILIAALSLIWTSHSIYCYFALRELKETSDIGASSTFIFSCALVAISVSLLLLTKNILPSTLNHEATFAWTLSESFYSLATLILTMAILSQYSLKPRESRAKTYQLYSITRSLKNILLIGGSLLCLLSALSSLYFQQNIANAAAAKGLAIDFPEIQGALLPLLHFYFYGCFALFSSFCLQFIIFWFAKFISPLPIKPELHSNSIKLKERTTLPS